MENNNENLTNQNNNGNQPGKKTYSAGLTVGILSIPCGLLLAISGWVLGIVGIIIIFACKKYALAVARALKS